MLSQFKKWLSGSYLKNKDFLPPQQLLLDITLSKITFFCHFTGCFLYKLFIPQKQSHIFYEIDRE